MSDTELREVYSAASIQEAQLIKTLLEDAGIEAQVVGSQLQNAVGELPAVAIAPRVWVHAEQLDKAHKLIEKQQAFSDSKSGDASSWTCGGCNEKNGPAFEICWNCHAARP